MPTSTDPADLVHYFLSDDAQLATWQQLASLSGIRHAYGRPLSQADYGSIRAALADHEADARG